MEDPTALKDFKWVASVPADSKRGVADPEPGVRTQITTNSETFSLYLTPLGVKHLVEEVQKVQTSIASHK